MLFCYNKDGDDMRIISGKFKGRRIDRVNKKTTRETADMVREAVFQMIEIHEDDIVLDIFAGSGSYAFEAISRGAKFAYLSDYDKDAVKTMHHNAELLNCANQVEILLRDDKKMLKKIESMRFNLIFIDPPYLYPTYAYLLMSLSKVTDNLGYVIVETEKKTILNDIYDQLHLQKEKTYGIKKISIYKKIA